MSAPQSLGADTVGRPLVLKTGKNPPEPPSFRHVDHRT
jgi:hypothetical protein